MQAIRDIIDVNANRISYKLPSRFAGKKVELIIFPVDDETGGEIETSHQVRLSLRGALKSFANPALRVTEVNAWKQAARLKHETH